MTTEYFSNKTTITARALFVGKRIDTKPFDKPGMLTASPIVTSAGADGYAALFRYGAVVLFNMTEIEEKTFLKDLEPYIVKKFDEYACEEEDVTVGKDLKDGHDIDTVTLTAWDMPRLQTIAEVLARSAVLNHYEASISQSFEKIEPITESLSKGQTKSKLWRGLLKQMGATLSIERQMVGQVEITDKPEILWELPEVEPLYMRLADEFEITERSTAVRHKLDLLYRTAETMSGLLQDKRTLHVEWYIVILIVIDILMSLAEKYLGF